MGCQCSEGGPGVEGEAAPALHQRPVCCSLKSKFKIRTSLEDNRRWGRNFIISLTNIIAVSLEKWHAIVQYSVWNLTIKSKVYATRLYCTEIPYSITIKNLYRYVLLLFILIVSKFLHHPRKKSSPYSLWKTLFFYHWNNELLKLVYQS